MDQSSLGYDFRPVYDMSFILERITVDETSGCWNWIYSKDTGGYAIVKKSVYGKPMNKGHRYSFYLYYGFVPDMACHKCNNRACVNPLHVYEGDYASNSRDMVNAGHQIRGKKVPSCKIDEEKAQQIRSLYASGSYSYRKLASMFDISATNVRAIVAKKTWKHV